MTESIESRQLVNFHEGYAGAAIDVPQDQDLLFGRGSFAFLDLGSF